MRFSLHIGVTGSHVPHKSLNRLHAAFMPDAGCRMPDAGCRAGSKQVAPCAYPTGTTPPWF
ncbi:hypothetical protein [Xenorhabdus nematophila]|uniref:hypothetical protein n=1 Tax=Xenorhabdus nematophila TaxID=628 RepID=UPI0012E098CC|nr:hypothetical protein [Xenorhabdus nematophila]